MQTEDYNYENTPLSALLINRSLLKNEMEWIVSIPNPDGSQRNVEDYKGTLTAIENELAKRGILEAESEAENDNG